MKMRFRSENSRETALALGLVLLGAAFRVLPHPDNFTPVTAIALFSGVVLPGGLAFTVPLLVMAVSDLFLGAHSLTWLVWPTFLLVTWIGRGIRDSKSPLPVLLASVGGSVLFFLVSNLGVFFVDNLYPRTWAGLVECFTMALPFFRNSFAGDLVYTAVLFTLFALARRSVVRQVIRSK